MVIVTRKSRHTRTLEALDEYQATLAVGGDRKAFALLYKRWHPKLLRFAFRKTGEVEAAQDVMQNAALTMAKDIYRLKDPSVFGAWAFMIVRRRAADFLKSKIRAREVQSELARQPEPDTSVGSEDALSLKQALRALPNADRQLLTFFYVDGMKISEIAAGLCVPAGTIKSRLFTAREKLKSVYEATEEGR